MILRFLTQLLKTDKSYASIFSAALDDGIKDTFKEMGYCVDKMRETGNKENKTPNCNSKVDDSMKH